MTRLASLLLASFFTLQTAVAVDTFALTGDPVVLIDGDYAAYLYRQHPELVRMPLVAVVSSDFAATHRHRVLRAGTATAPAVILVRTSLLSHEGRAVTGWQRSQTVAVVDDSLAEGLVNDAYTIRMDGRGCTTDVEVSALVSPDVLTTEVYDSLPWRTQGLPVVGIGADGEFMPGMTRLDPRDVGGLDVAGINPEPKQRHACIEANPTPHP